MKPLLPIALLALFAPVPGAEAAASTGGPVVLFDLFEGGLNKGGWSFDSGDTLETLGGSPGGYWHQPLAYTYAPVIRSTNPLLAADWRANGITRMQWDARLDDLEFGDGTGYLMSLLLRDTKGTPSPIDDDYAYLVGDNIPLRGAGWKSFSFPIPSQDTSAVPTGWKGGWAGDDENFRPGIDWNDVITNVDRVEIHWLHPAFIAQFQNWDVGLDNISIQSTGTATVRNGSGVNPLGYSSTSAPNIGTTWTSTVDIVTPGHAISFVAVSLAGSTSGIFPGASMVGELLVRPSFFSLDVAAGAHAFPIPARPGLLGLCISTQGGTIAPTGTIHLNNAIDIGIGG